MNSFYDVGDAVAHLSDHSVNRSASSASSTMSTEQDRRDTPRQQQNPHNPHNHHRGLRYVAQQLRSQHPDHYTHPIRRPERAREMRRRSSPAASAGSSDLFSHDRLQQQQQQQQQHRPNSLKRAAHEHEHEGYLLSAISGDPSLEVEDLRHAHRGSDTLPTPQTDDGEEASVLQEKDAVVPTWSQGSRLLERRILQAVDQETMEPQLEEEEALWASQVGPSAQALGAVASRTPGNGLWQFGTPPLAPTSAANLSPTTQERHAAAATGPPRMKEAALLADPRNQLLDLVITNTSGSVTLSEIETTMQWSRRYEPMYGALLEYLQSYQSIFVVSPVDDHVRLRRDFSSRTTQAAREGRTSTSPSQTQRSSRTRRSRRSRARESAGSMRSPSAVERRPGKPSLPSAEALAAHIGSVSYSCVGEHLNLDVLETVYRRRGYDTAMMHTVLHVTTQENTFHLFCFSSGAVVWWGMDRKDHWMVEDDFLSAAVHIAEGVSYRYAQSEINALFPIWCSFEVDEQCSNLQITSPLGIQPAAVKPSLERLSAVLCFDHYLVPAKEPGRSLVMLTFSHSLGHSARVDYFEYVTKWSHRHILSIPAEFSGLLDYFSTKRRIAKLEGEIEVAQLAIQSIHDTPEVLWDVPWLQAYYDMAEQQNTVQSRLSWFASRSDTLLEQLSHIKARRHRLFMLGSDVFLIVILILDVMFMTSRLVAKMYFKVEEED